MQICTARVVLNPFHEVEIYYRDECWRRERAHPLSILKIPTAKIFEPLLKPARYKGVYGGRGSGKSHFFGELLVETCQAERGTLAVCIREAQRTLAQSSKRLIEGKIASLGLGHGFKLFSDKIETPGDGLIIFRGLHANLVVSFYFAKRGFENVARIIKR